MRTRTASASVLASIALLATGCGGSSKRPSTTTTAPRGTTQLTFVAFPTPQQPVVTQASLERAAQIIRTRLLPLGAVAGSVIIQPGNRVVVDLPGANPSPRETQQVGARAELAFYDWEPNVLAPSGKPVAALLQAQDPGALMLSQGAAADALPGAPGTGSQALYDAVTLAAKQPASSSPDNTRKGSEYYLFGAVGSQACATAAKALGKTPAPGSHCLLSGPDLTQQDLVARLPAGVGRSQGQMLEVKPGTVVLQAADPSPARAVQFNDPTAQFYVLKDRAALLGTDVINPHQSTNQAGDPIVDFGFTPAGANKFQTTTRTISHRGQLVSGLAQPLNQHFAVALDRKLITVPAIDFKQYPDGIPAKYGADIAGGFTLQSAIDVANLLRLGALPVALELISARTLAPSK